MFVDTHTHFYDEWLLPDAEAAVQRALEAGVGKMIQADIDSRERPDMWAIGNRHPGVLFQMLGVYPGSLTPDNWQDELDRVHAFEGPIVAIGEVGLDYHEGKEYAEIQKEALRAQLELASAKNLPVNIHLRDAWEDFFEVLEDCRHLHLRGNLHCFSGSFEAYERANRSGEWSVGIGGVITFKNNKLAQTLERIPMERILLETDAPYLAPTPHRGERNESAFLPLIAAKLAEVKGISPGECERITTRNAETLFGI
ncbi:MAG: TatD family hydrolase [Bacteroidales bacterium]|nr:TatD family hydrolase [Bacteroidales bacterium]